MYCQESLVYYLLEVRYLNNSLQGDLRFQQFKSVDETFQLHLINQLPIEVSKNVYQFSDSPSESIIPSWVRQSLRANELPESFKSLTIQFT